MSIFSIFYYVGDKENNFNFDRYIEHVSCRVVLLSDTKMCQIRRHSLNMKCPSFIDRNIIELSVHCHTVSTVYSMKGGGGGANYV